MAPKKVLPQESPFLRTAAEAIGTTLGKLALRTGGGDAPIKTVTKKAAPKKSDGGKKAAVAKPAGKAAKKKISR